MALASHISDECLPHNRRSQHSLQNWNLPPPIAYAVIANKLLCRHSYTLKYVKFAYVRLATYLPVKTFLVARMDISIGSLTPEQSTHEVDLSLRL